MAVGFNTTVGVVYYVLYAFTVELVFIVFFATARTYKYEHNNNFLSSSEGMDTWSMANHPRPSKSLVRLFAHVDSGFRFLHRRANHRNQDRRDLFSRGETIGRPMCTQVQHIRGIVKGRRTPTRDAVFGCIPRPVSILSLQPGTPPVDSVYVRVASALNEVLRWR